MHYYKFDYKCLIDMLEDKLYLFIEEEENANRMDASEKIFITESNEGFLEELKFLINSLKINVVQSEKNIKENDELLFKSLTKLERVSYPNIKINFETIFLLNKEGDYVLFEEGVFKVLTPEFYKDEFGIIGCLTPDLEFNHRFYHATCSKNVDNKIDKIIQKGIYKHGKFTINVENFLLDLNFKFRDDRDIKLIKSLFKEIDEKEYKAINIKNTFK